MKIKQHLYLHIPFCDKPCPYCAFFKSINKKPMQDWFRNLVWELENHLEQIRLRQQSIETVYFGGGSPDLLSKEQISILSEKITPFLSEDYEWTMEINPGAVSENYLAHLKQAGINRISVGVQSFHPARLKALGRPDLARVLQTIHLVKKLGFLVSVDLIYGYEDQSFQELKEDLDRFLSLDIHHLSFYSLLIEEGSAYYKLGIKPLSEQKDALFYSYIAKRLKQEGFDHYEISSFCKNGEYSRHNLAYWSDQYFLGIGPGASGYDQFGYYTHRESLLEYNRGIIRIQYEPRDPFNAIMMSLRTGFGLNFERWNRTYSMDFLEKYKDQIEKYRDYFIVESDRIYLNSTGRKIMDFILLDFMEE